LRRPLEATPIAFCPILGDLALRLANIECVRAHQLPQPVFQFVLLFGGPLALDASPWLGPEVLVVVAPPIPSGIK
jgi:hypothetical protein